MKEHVSRGEAGRVAGERARGAWAVERLSQNGSPGLGDGPDDRRGGTGPELEARGDARQKHSARAQPIRSRSTACLPLCPSPV